MSQRDVETRRGEMMSSDACRRHPRHVYDLFAAASADEHFERTAMAHFQFGSASLTHSRQSFSRRNGLPFIVHILVQGASPHLSLRCAISGLLNARSQNNENETAEHAH